MVHILTHNCEPCLSPQYIVSPSVLARAALSEYQQSGVAKTVITLTNPLRVRELEFQIVPGLETCAVVQGVSAEGSLLWCVLVFT